MEYRWFKKNGVEFNPRIIPDMEWHSRIEPYFNSLTLRDGFQDKNYYELIVGKDNSPVTVCRCINGQLLNGEYSSFSINKFKEEIADVAELICKPSVDSGGGRGVTFINCSEISETALNELKKTYKSNFIIQKVIQQHDFYAAFNETSLNTLRVLTFLHNGEVKVLSAFLRAGGKGSRVDNVSSGGCFVPVSNKGMLSKYAITKNKKTHDILKVVNSFDCEGIKIPHWNGIIELLYKTHYKLAHFGLINWDVTVTQNNVPVVVEYNVKESSVSTHQLGNGAIMGDDTDQVLEEVYRK